MNNIIIKELKEFEKQNNAKILLAIEAGSRTWGFESKDSEYDVRFIYVKDKNHYLQLNEQKDVIELVHTDELDIVGWDLKKFLKLMKKSNPSVYEFLHISSIYIEDESFYKIREVAPHYFFWKDLAWHYFSMSYKHDRRYILNTTPTKKRYLYAIRGIFSAYWVIDHKSVPPTDFEIIKNEFCPKNLIPIVDGLVVDKKCGIANEKCDRIGSLDKMLEQSYIDIQNILNHSKEYRLDYSWDELNRVFLEFL